MFISNFDALMFTSLAVVSINMNNLDISATIYLDFRTKVNKKNVHGDDNFRESLDKLGLRIVIWLLHIKHYPH